MLLKSANILDQRTLGFSMRVERANVDQVKDRLELLKRKISNKDNVRVPSASEEYESKLALQVAEEERLKRQRKDDLLTRQKERHAGIIIGACIYIRGNLYCRS
jgi:hypothetical protein